MPRFMHVWAEKRSVKLPDAGGTSRASSARHDAYIVEALSVAEVSLPVVVTSRTVSSRGTSASVRPLRHERSPELWTTFCENCAVASSVAPGAGLKHAVSSALRALRPKASWLASGQR